MALAGGTMDPAGLMPESVDLETERHVTRLQAVARGGQTRRKMQTSRTLTEEQKEKLAVAQSATDERRNFYASVHEVLGVSKEEYNSCPAMQEAHSYLERHQIPRLFESLLARAALERPKDLRGFLKNTLVDIKKSKGKPSMGVFSEEDLKTMFDMWDELKHGSIPPEKVVETLQALQCHSSRAAAEEAVMNKLEEGVDQVDKRTFMKIVRSELEAMFAAPS
mmetsp:Transcript_85968/g.161911  ORF Transcript_85968/g.161911 Transcript_85968/m.161911 type:complete len:222 (+) Transcript_85968:112-777(+)